MGGGDGRAAAPTGAGDEKIVTQGAGGGLEAQMVSAGVNTHIAPADLAGEGAAGAEGAHEILITVGFGAAQLMVEMGGGQRQTPLRRQLGEKIEQHHRIEPAREGDQHPHARLQQVVLTDIRDESVEHLCCALASRSHPVHFFTAEFPRLSFPPRSLFHGRVPSPLVPTPFTFSRPSSKK
ncbi:MAG: hypothetical protein BWY77_00424 [bacterium ADurb.Bin431]|nr:MAG: hypothetical protein BWY77_00424 [bacterium ADurb.Bin431]